MSLAPLTPTRKAADAERRQRILEAAERAFVRHGFHATTMQHVAEEIGMSAGNLYRYFPSKEAIVEGLCAVDQAGRARAFAELMAHNGNIMEAISAGLREHVLGRPAEKARMIVEIWAEAARNPAVDAITRSIDSDVLAKIEHLIFIAKERGEASPAVDAASVARFFFTYVGGLMKRLALEPDLDAEAETARASELFIALCKGALAPIGTGGSR